MARPRVLLVHGINDNARWHGQVSRLLEPHFECRSILYREYHICPLGIPLVFWGAALPLAPAVVVVGASSLYPSLQGMADVVLLVLLFLASYVVFSHEFDWNGARDFLLLPVLLMAGGLLMAALGFAGWIGPGSRQIALILALTAQVVVVEARVYHFRHPNHTLGWDAWKFVWPYPLPIYALVLWCLAGWAAGLNEWASTAVWGTALVALFVWAWIEAERRRLRTRDKVFAQFTVNRRAEGNTHLIAHSLGSYMTGLILEDQLGKGRTLQLGSLILVGCVLPREYNWGLQLRSPGEAVRAVWNIQGRLDDVAHAAGQLLGRLVPRRRFGSAGKDGFNGSPTEVHDVLDPFAACPSCLWKIPGRVHNIILETGTHASTFLSQIDPVDLWLPFLWEIAPGEFRSFRKLCREGQEALDDARLDRFDEKEAEFSSRRWNWTRWPGDGERVLDWVTKTLPHSRNALNALLTRRQFDAGPATVEPFLFRYLCHLQSAIRELLSPDSAALSPLTARILALAGSVLAVPGGRPADRDELLRFLHPERALTLGLGMALIELK